MLFISDFYSIKNNFSMFFFILILNQTFCQFFQLFVWHKMGFEVSISTISAQNEKEVATLKPPPGLFQWKFPIIRNEGNISEPGFMVAESKYILPEFEKKTKSYLKIHRETVDIITNSTSKGLTQLLDEPGAAIGGVCTY